MRATVMFLSCSTRYAVSCSSVQGCVLPLAHELSLYAICAQTKHYKKRGGKAGLPGGPEESGCCVSGAAGTPGAPGWKGFATKGLSKAPLEPHTSSLGLRRGPPCGGPCGCDDDGAPPGSPLYAAAGSRKATTSLMWGRSEGCSARQISATSAMTASTGSGTLLGSRDGSRCSCKCVVVTPSPIQIISVKKAATSLENMGVTNLDHQGNIHQWCGRGILCSRPKVHRERTSQDNHDAILANGTGRPQSQSA